ncbi:hypothetical protein HPB50_001779 [Hyalomma asiaticum]|uniref:Uncharacterized protein n=1 Tax=Hyalomma asiaticum TaxID=266040 RepID=A0ACB7T5R5_HYAAI|nr:hypothetical protein HPB50_001779 [Hyalomma asiaticum]
MPPHRCSNPVRAATVNDEKTTACCPNAVVVGRPYLVHYSPVTQEPSLRNSFLISRPAPQAATQPLRRWERGEEAKSRKDTHDGRRHIGRNQNPTQPPPVHTASQQSVPTSQAHQTHSLYIQGKRRKRSPPMTGTTQSPRKQKDEKDETKIP